MAAIERLRRKGLHNLPLFWKVLLPFLGLIIVVGLAGAYIVVRFLTDRAEATLDAELQRRTVEARTAVRDRELYLLEAINFAAHVEGMAGAAARRDRATVGGLMRSVQALKPEVDLLAVVDRRGGSLASYGRHAPGEITRAIERSFAGRAEADATRASLLTEIDSNAMVIVSGRICSTQDPCALAGTVVAGFDLSSLSLEALTRSDRGGLRQLRSASGLSIFDREGDRLETAGTAAPRPPLTLGARIPRRSHVQQVELASLYAPLSLGDRRAGVVAVTIPTEPLFGPVRAAAMRLVAVILSAMFGIIALGTAISGSILRQVRPLVGTSRKLGSGEFDARAPVQGNDELGQLAIGINHMAAQLQASHRTLESRVAQRTEEVQRLLQERTEFFASMSHEFRTPLAVIISESDLLKDPRHRLTPRRTLSSVSTIRASAEQLLEVTNEILDIARADSGRIEVELRTIAMVDVVKAVRPTLEGLAKAGGLRLHIELPKELSPVTADPGRVREIVLNLVDNAVKYTHPGGSITISAHQQNGSVILSVEDSGVGIDPGVGDRIFEPFFRVKGSKPVRGQASSGLGLALAKRFVEAQGGTLSFVSEPNRGSTFSMSLPAAKRGRRTITRTRS